MKLAAVLAVLLLIACGEPERSSDVRVSVAGIEQSAFVRKHVVRERRSIARPEGGVTHVFLIEDAYQKDGVTLELWPSAESVTGLRVTWPGGAAPAAWSSIKKQFVADLLEATFWDIDYGEVSTYLVEHGARRYDSIDAVPRHPMRAVKIHAGVVGTSLVVGFER
jgi:hypothetical protein